MIEPDQIEPAAELTLIRRSAHAAARRLWARAALARITISLCTGAGLWLTLVLISRLGELDLGIATGIAIAALAVWLAREVTRARATLVAGAQALDRAGTDAADAIATALELGESTQGAAALTRARALEHLEELAGARVPSLWPGRAIVPRLSIAILMITVGVLLALAFDPHQTEDERQQEALRRFSTELRAAAGGGSTGENASEDPIEATISAALERAWQASTPKEAAESMVALEQALAQATDDRRQSEAALVELEASLLQTDNSGSLQRALESLPEEERERIAARLAELGARAAPERARAIARLQLAAAAARQQLARADTLPDSTNPSGTARSAAIAYDAGAMARPGQLQEPPASHRDLVDRYFEILDAR